jgi:hypothetical protein
VSFSPILAFSLADVEENKLEALTLFTSNNYLSIENFS